MSNRNPEIDNSALSDVLDFWLEQRLKTWVHTALPGAIVEYDGPTKRAIVQPQIRLRLTDGSEMRLPPIVNVPVVHGGGGGLAAHYPLKREDKVMLIFSERGLTTFKQLWAEATPDLDKLFDRQDAVAFPWSTAKDITIVDNDAITLQTDDGEDYVAFKRGQFFVKIGRSTIDMTDTDILLDSPHIGLND